LDQKNNKYSFYKKYSFNKNILLTTKKRNIPVLFLLSKNHFDKEIEIPLKNYLFISLF